MCSICQGKLRRLSPTRQLNPRWYAIRQNLHERERIFSGLDPIKPWAQLRFYFFVAFVSWC
jgi:hypothetical protein